MSTKFGNRVARGRMIKTSRQRGSEGEVLARDFLAERGFTIICTNWHGRYGEIDIIAQTIDGTTVFVEVKSGDAGKYGHPLEWITERKVLRLRRAIDEYVFKNALPDSPMRADAIIIDTRTQKIVHLCDIL